MVLTAQETDAIATAAQYAHTPLPRTPRLVPWLTFVDLGDDRLQLRGADFSFTLRHPLLIQTFHLIAPLLDGRHTVDEIAAAACDGVLPTTILFLLSTLQANGLLHEGAFQDVFDLEQPTRWERQIRFLSHMVANPAAAQKALARARVAVLGPESFGSAIHAALDAIGVGQVTRSSAAAVIGDGISDLGVDGTDLLIVCQDSPGFALFEAINAACLRSGARWMHVAMHGVTAILGPTFVPPHTACYTCYDRRRQSHVADLDGYTAYRRQVGHDDGPADEGILFPLWSVVAGQVALETARLLTGYAPPVTVGRLYELSVLNSTAAAHEVLRVPRCPSCSPRAAAREAWDQAWVPMGEDV